MANPNYVIFDFDGTIADTLELVKRIYNNLAPEYGCKLVEKIDNELLGAKKPQELLKKYGVTPVKLPFLVLKMRNEISKHVSEIQPVKNIHPALFEIKNAGFNLGIMTSNATGNVRHFLKSNGLDGIFDFIHTSKHIFGKDKSLLRLFKTENIPRDNAVYVGDEKRDVEAARKAGIPMVSVSWGYMSREILAALEPEQIADRPDELLQCIQRIFDASRLS
jgi:phosphoglycolate phosphatase